ncbi:glycosyltransferase [Muriicola marianensis]|uniref:Glycosyl transferase family 2 n=1 Tax=Muriicola marianensis TaxID=1324801 RepID=A0ABQ1QMV0_9FLAO|nr:glycosyltransferase [Muriicola marianensis]GGD37294.1 glycosyl transferase family 2 [Muriicola marianensis]
MQPKYSLIIPVFNRPEEIRELLQSLLHQSYQEDFEVVIVEDGSDISSEAVVKEFKDSLTLSYYFKANSGPGDSRNFGMRKARGDYFIILDSDCILPPEYLQAIDFSLAEEYTDFFGGPDTAHPDFSNTQKAINYAMTSFLTTGGIRGSEKGSGKFQPRSFNMGISRKAFEASQGFGNIHPGEDPDLTIRLWNLGFTSKLIPEASVYHKRRIDFSKFYRQVKKFGMVRPILNHWHPGTAKLTYWFPFLFCAGFLLSVILAIAGSLWLLYIFAFYLLLILIDSTVKNRSLGIGFLSLYAVIVQFYGYGTGFFKSTFLLTFSKKKPQELFPSLFFRS